MEIVSYSSAEGIGRIRISRPARRNALNQDAVDQLRASVWAAAEEGVRVLVVSGTDGHFCAGADLSELEDQEFTTALRLTLDDLAALRVPTIAAIAGSCMGLGMQIALACDLRIATPDARFAVPVAKLGLMVDHWTLRRLAMLAGQSTARWLTMTASPIDAQRAYEVGFVQQLVELPEGGSNDAPADSSAVVGSAAEELAVGITSLAPLALSGTKTGLDALEWDVSDEAAYLEAFNRAWESEDLVEGRTAFGERRSPIFKGR